MRVFTAPKEQKTHPTQSELWEESVKSLEQTLENTLKQNRHLYIKMLTEAGVAPEKHEDYISSVMLRTRTKMIKAFNKELMRLHTMPLSEKSQHELKTTP